MTTSRHDGTVAVPIDVKVFQLVCKHKAFCRLDTQTSSYLKPLKARRICVI